MANICHRLLNRNACTGHSRDDSDSGAVKRSVRADTFPVPFRTAFQEPVPFLGGHAGKGAGPVKICFTQLANQGDKGRVKLGGEHVAPFRMEGDASGSLVDIAQGDTRFADAAPLVQGNFKGNGHPPFAQRKVAFPFDQAGADGGHVGVGEFGLLGVAVARDAHSFKRACSDVATVNRFAHGTGEKSELPQGGVVRRIFFGNAFNLARPPFYVVKAKLISDGMRSANLALGEERIQPAPAVEFAVEGRLAISVLEAQPLGHPAIKAGRWGDGAGGACFGGKLACHVERAFESLRVVAPALRALGDVAQTFRTPVTNPPIRRISAFVDAGSAQVHERNKA